MREGSPSNRRMSTPVVQNSRRVLADALESNRTL